MSHRKVKRLPSVLLTILLIIRRPVRCCGVKGFLGLRWWPLVVGRALAELSSSFSCPLVAIGDRGCCSSSSCSPQVGPMASTIISWRRRESRMVCRPWSLNGVAALVNRRIRLAAKPRFPLRNQKYQLTICQKDSACSIVRLTQSHDVDDRQRRRWHQLLEKESGSSIACVDGILTISGLIAWTDFLNCFK